MKPKSKAKTTGLVVLFAGILALVAGIVVALVADVIAALLLLFLSILLNSAGVTILRGARGKKG